MKRQGKKSQASLEYLIIYGFGILMVIASLLLAWQSGLFTKISPQNRGIGGFSQLTVEDFKAQGNLLNLTIKNNAPDRVRVNKINATLEYKKGCYSGETVNMAPGDKISVELTCSDLAEKYPVGEYYKANIIIEYLNNRSSKLHRSLGYIWGTVE